MLVNFLVKTAFAGVMTKSQHKQTHLPLSDGQSRVFVGKHVWILEDWRKGKGTVAVKGTGTEEEAGDGKGKSKHENFKMECATERETLSLGWCSGGAYAKQWIFQWQ